MPVLAATHETAAQNFPSRPIKAKYDEVGLHPATPPRDQYIAFLQRDSRTWSDVVTKGNIEIEET